MAGLPAAATGREREAGRDERRMDKARGKTRDAQTITPEALQSVKAALATSDVLDPAASASARPADPSTNKKPIPRRAAGQSWEDPTLTDWPENDYRLFCGDLGNEVNDDVLSKAFSRFPSFNMARVVRDKRTGKTKGYEFVSFSNPTDLAAAIKEMNGKYVGNRPIKLRKSNWKERTDVEALERQKCCCLENWDDSTSESSSLIYCTSQDARLPAVTCSMEIDNVAPFRYGVP
ncbi:hypothetical protein PAHAL_2G437500 [Panicum hallii]|uniref:RRM domain-containing protein n=1 Tax=Panicum hallii TaxID=206008 RepID=A0A2T8KSP3_9POAL|nr:hypothetical protein PAHAL_2G437500 [Panicum hallii]